MYLQKTSSSYGRLVAAPAKEDSTEAFFEERINLQDQIDNLRTKITLKERFNKAQADELEECRLGAKSITTDLWTETHKLRNQLADALDAEKSAVYNALRTHLDFQRALKGKAPDFAVDWLDDQVFHMSKRLNYLLDTLSSKRIKLKDSEDLVNTFEMRPNPAHSKWEAAQTKVCQKLEYSIENMKVKRETAMIIHSKYHTIKHLLLDERGHYAPTLTALENQLENQRRELIKLKKMLEEAINFKTDSLRNLLVTENEASEKRKRRRRQMLRMKKAVQKVLEANTMSKLDDSAKPSHVNVKRSFGNVHAVIPNPNVDPSQVDLTIVLRNRRTDFEKYQDKARRLVDVMRVPDLSCIPERLREVSTLSARLTHDQERKEQTREFLIRQRDQLLLIYNYLAHTGQKAEGENKAATSSVNDATELVEREIREIRKKIKMYGEITIEVRVGLISILEIFEQSPPKIKRLENTQNLRPLLKILNAKLATLKTSIEQDLENSQQAKADWDDPDIMKTYIRNAPIPPRLVRIGSAEKKDDSDVDEYDDLKVLTRAEIKAKSARILSNALLKKGFM